MLGVQAGFQRIIGSQAGGGVGSAQAAQGDGVIGSQGHTGEDGHQGGDQDVYLGLLGHRLAQLSGDDGDEQHGQGAARAAQGKGGPHDDG